MAKAALFVSWNDIKPGREGQALETFAYAVEFWGKRQAEKKIESFEPVLLDPHGEGAVGFFLIRGESSSLDAIRASTEYVDLMSRCMHVTQGLCGVTARINEGVQQFLQSWQKSIPR
jgi:hypothetical protein